MERQGGALGGIRWATRFTPTRLIATLSQAFPNPDPKPMQLARSRFKTKWQAWKALTVRERGMLLRLSLGLLVVHTGLRMAGYARVRRWCDRLGGAAPRRAPGPADMVAAKRLAQLAAIAGRHGLVAATCLRQALVVTTVLRRQGFDAQLQLGVHQDGEAFGAHAWVELAGVMLDVTEAVAYDTLRH